MFAIQLVLFLFLSSAALVRRAQNEFYKNDGHNPLRGLFQFEGGNIAQGKDSLDSGNIQKVIGILQNNIKQWSFIESQLLEPNVNLGMPEIFIPLKHLTTTLEILGNIFFVQNDLSAAQSHLERACPLMELLPPNLLSDEDFAAAAGEALEDSGLRLLDPTDLTSYLWMGTGTGSGPGPALGAAQEGNTEGSTRSNTYAAGCYSLLRDVYAKLYYGETNNNVPDSEMGPPPTAALEETSSKSNGHIPSPREFPTSTTTTLKYSPHQAGYHSCLLPNGKPREFNLKYLLSKRQQTQQMKARALFSRLNTSNSRGSSMSSTTSASVAAPLGGIRSPAGGNAGAAGAAGAGRSTKVSGAKLSMSGATAGTAFLEKSLSAAAAAQLQQEHELENDNSEGGTEEGHRRRNHALLLGVDGDGLYSDETADEAVKVADTTTNNNVKPRRTSVFSGTDDEVEEEAVLSSTATSPLPAAMPAVAADAEAEAGAKVAGTDTRKPSPLRSEVDDNSGHGSGHPDGTARPRVRGQVPQPQAQAQLQSQKRTFDFEEKLRDLRSPYEHLRSELELVQDLQHQNNNNNNNNKKKKNNKQSQSNARTSSRVAQAAAAMDEDGADADGDFDHIEDSAEMAGGAGRRVGLGLGLSASPSVVGQKRPNKSPQPIVRGFEGSSLNYLNGEDITAPGVSTSIIADDLETLLRKFVQTNKRNRRELLLQARKYYDELDINFPNMDYNEYAANMDMGQAYLEVMTKVVQEGSFSFVGVELDNWGVAAAAEAQRAQKQQAGGGGAVVGAKGKGKSAAGVSGKDKSATSKESTAPVQFTMAEKNRLLVLYAFDLMHSNPSDPSDLGLGFNRGIEDNDRGRRGDHFMVDALSDAAASLGLDSALTGLLGFHGEVNDAHKRLFPHHSAPHGNGHDYSAASLLKESNVLDQLAEQHLRDLLSSSTEGSSGSGSGSGPNAAEEYFAARAAAKAAASASASQPSAATDASSQTTKAAKNKRRKQRQQQMEGGGEYTREDNSNNNYRPTNSGGGYFSGGGQNGDGAGDIFYDEDMTGGASLRSVPTLGADGDWTLSLFVLFMLLTGAVVYSAYQEAARKKLASGRARARPIGSASGGGGQNGAGKKASSSSGGAGSGVMLSGTAVVDFMYAQLNGPTAGSSVSTVEAEKSESDAKSSAAIATASTASAGSSGSKLSWMFTTNGGSNASGTGAAVNGAAGSSKAAKKTAAAAAAAKDAAHQQSDKASENAAAKASSSSNVAVSSNNPKKGKKGKDKDKNKDITSANGSTTALSSAPSAPNPTTGTTAAKTIANTNSSTSTAKISASTSSTSLHSVTDDSHRSSHRDSDSSSSEDEFLSSHPVSVNHRRVSWAGLIPGATTTTSVDPIPVPRGGFAGDMGIMEQGDWAEARKKGSKRNANTSNGTASASGGAEEKTQEHLPQRIALGLKDSPLYRQQPRPYQPQQQHAQVLPGRGVPHAGSVDAAGAAGAARKPSSATTQVQGQVQGRAVSAADIAAGLSSAASLPYSRAAAAGGAAVNSQNGGAGNAVRSGSKAPTYDLSEAKKMAEQLGGWNVGSSPVAATTSTTSFAAPVSVAKASTSVSAAAAAAPPGLLPLRAINSAHTASASAAVSVAESPRSLPSGGVSPANSAKASQQFGFSQFDLSASSATVSSGSYPVGVSWSTASTTSHPSLASLAASLGATGTCSANSSIVSTAGRGSVNSALAAQSAYALSDSGRPEDIGDLNTSNGSTNAYLSNIVSFLDSPAYKPPGSKASAKTAAAAASRSPMSDLYGDPYHRQDGAGLYAATTATATTSTVSAATLDFGSTGGSGGGLGSDYDSLHMDEAGYYHVPSADQQGQGQDHHLNQDHQGELYYQQLYGNQQQYDQQQYRPDESAYFPHSNAQYEHGFQHYGEYHGEEEEGHTFSTPAPAVGNGSTAAAGRERRDHGGLRQVALQQASADFAPSITLEASSLYGLSPDAPSFRPSQLRTATNNTSAGVASNGNSGAALDASMSGINRLSAFSGRYDEALSLPPPPLSLSMSMSLGSPSLGLFDDSLSLPALLQPSSSASVSVSGHANANSAQALFSTDDFYDSIMIDSILREAEGDGADE